MKLASVLIAASGLLGNDPLAAAERPTEESFIPNYSAASLHYLWGSATDLRDVPGSSMSLHEAGILAQYPLWQTEANRLTAGVRYRWNRLDFDAPTPFAAGDLDVYRVQIPVNYWHTFSDAWKVWGGVEPGMFTDFEAVSGDDLAVTALAVAAWEFHTKWSLSFGAYYSRDLGEDRALPVLGVIWRPSPHWNLSATFPRVRIAWAPDESWVVEGLVRPGGSAWNIRTADGRDLDVEYRSWRATLSVERLLSRKPIGRLYGFIEVGLGFGQDLKLTDADELAASDLDETFTTSVGLRLRF